MVGLLSRLFADDTAQDLVEYGVVLAIIAGVVGIIALGISTDVQSIWTNAQSTVHAAV